MSLHNRRSQVEIKDRSAPNDCRACEKVAGTTERSTNSPSASRARSGSCLPSSFFSSRLAYHKFVCFDSKLCVRVKAQKDSLEVEREVRCEGAVLNVKQKNGN
jgi:hypothetical protein